MRRKVMIVDDSEINREILRAMLTEEYEVVEAANGKEALERLLPEPDSFSAVLLDLIMPQMDGYEVLKHVRADAKMKQLPIIVTTGSTDEGAEIHALTLGANDYVMKPYNPEIIRHRLHNTINLRETAAIVNATRYDALTGLYSRAAFFEIAEEMIQEKAPGFYVMACFDIESFKVINDQYGNGKGDEVLRSIANIFREGFAKAGGICCRIMADNYAVLYPADFMDSRELADIREKASRLDGSILPITFSIGRYIVEDLYLSPSAMYDRATMAKESIKGRFDQHIATYEEDMWNWILRQQEITSEMKPALEAHQFEVWFQPQYNHVTGALVGAEALVRWRHPKKGLISPGIFIPIFEKNGFVYEVDKYVWEQTCILQRRWLDEGRSPVPVSVNISRYDILREDLVDFIWGLIQKYQLPVDLLRLEITESAFAKSGDMVVRVVKRFQKLGFLMEIDDFGSGYSSLNTLKDVPADVLKLDMRFLEGEENSTRGGNILESIVRMAKWLGMSIIAEGVETREQADFLKTIGCNYIQGYYYARPMPEADFEKLEESCEKEETQLELEMVEMLDNDEFWNPKSMETLIFNSFVGGASVFEYRQGETEILRVNDAYAQILCGRSMKPDEAMNLNWLDYTDDEGRQRAFEVMRRAIENQSEETDELRLTGICGEGQVTYLRSALRVIGHTGDRYLFYCRVEDITSQKLLEQKTMEQESRMRELLETMQVGAGIFEYAKEVITSFYVNGCYQEMTGRKVQELSHASVMNAVMPEDRAMLLRILKEVEKSGECCRECDIHILHADGVYRRFHLTGHIVKRNEKMIIYTVCQAAGEL